MRKNLFKSLLLLAMGGALSTGAWATQYCDTQLTSNTGWNGDYNFSAEKVDDTHSAITVSALGDELITGIYQIHLRELGGGTTGKTIFDPNDAAFSDSEVFSVAPDGKSATFTITWTTYPTSDIKIYLIMRRNNSKGGSDIFGKEISNIDVSSSCSSQSLLESDLTITSENSLNFDLASASLTNQIAYTTTSTGNVTYSTNKESVATVTSTGFITAVGVGSATITVTQAEDATYRRGVQTINVTVTNSNEPTVKPTHATWPEAEKVRAIYSTHYSQTAMATGDWGGRCVFTPTVIEGDQTMKFAMSDAGYAGTQWAAIDASFCEYLHIDIWSANAFSLGIVPISQSHGSLNCRKTVNVTAGTWNSIDIPVNEFVDGANVLSLNDIYQIKYDNAPYAIFWIANVYFYTTQAVDNQAPVMTSATCISTTYKSAVLSVAATDNVGVSKYIVKDGDAVVGEYTPENNEITINNLAAETTYDYTVYAKDATGNISTSGIDVNFTTSAFDWNSANWISGSGDKLKFYCKGGVNVVSVQKPAWADANGVYLTCGTGISDCTASSYKIDGAGVIIYLTALTAIQTNFTITEASGTHTVSIYNVDGAAMDVDVTAAGWASVCLPYDAVIPTGVTAYRASLATNSAITLSPITGDIPANEGVIINAAQGTHTFAKAASAPAPITNLFTGVIIESNVPNTDYVLAGVENNLPYFQLYNGGAMSPNKAYLKASKLTAGTPERINFVIEGNPVATGIQNATAVKATKALVDGKIVIVRNGAMFNLNGMLVK